MNKRWGAHFMNSMKISVKILLCFLIIAIISAISMLCALLISYAFVVLIFITVIAVWLLLSKNLTKPFKFLARELSDIA